MKELIKIGIRNEMLTVMNLSVLMVLKVLKDDLKDVLMQNKFDLRVTEDLEDGREQPNHLGVNGLNLRDNLGEKILKSSHFVVTIVCLRLTLNHNNQSARLNWFIN